MRRGQGCPGSKTDVTGWGVSLMPPPATVAWRAAVEDAAKGATGNFANGQNCSGWLCCTGRMGARLTPYEVILRRLTRLCRAGESGSKRAAEQLQAAA